MWIIIVVLLIIIWWNLQTLRRKSTWKFCSQDHHVVVCPWSPGAAWEEKKNNINDGWERNKIKLIYQSFWISNTTQQGCLWLCTKATKSDGWHVLCLVSLKNFFLKVLVLEKMDVTFNLHTWMWLFAGETKFNFFSQAILFFAKYILCFGQLTYKYYLTLSKIYIFHSNNRAALWCLWCSVGVSINRKAA